MSLTENSDQVFLPGVCNRTQNMIFGPYTNNTVDQHPHICQNKTYSPQSEDILHYCYLETRHTLTETRAPNETTKTCLKRPLKIAKSKVLIETVA